MTKRINAKHGVVCQNNESPFNVFGWPSVAKLPDGTLAVVASGFRIRHICPFGKSIICYSRDGGETWTRPQVLIDTKYDDRDSGITLLGGNRVMVTSFHTNIKTYYEHLHDYCGDDIANLKKSYLDMFDWTEEELDRGKSYYIISEDGGYTFGEIKNAPVSAPHGPCVTINGDVLYFGIVLNPTDPDYAKQIECWRMLPNGEFEFYSKIDVIVDEKGEPLISCEPFAIMLPSGKLIVQIRVQSQEKTEDVSLMTIYQCESYDGGKTFTKPHDIGNNGIPPHIIRHSSGVLIGSYGYRWQPYGERIMLSYDDGETWDMDYVLRDDGVCGDLGYACTTELDDGSLITVYYQAEVGTTNPIIMYSKWSLDDVER